MSLPRNVGTGDRAIRAFFGVLLIALVVLGTATQRTEILVGLIGTALLVSAGVGYCPLYRLLKVSTVPPAAPGSA